MKLENVVTLTQKAVAQVMGDTYMSQLGEFGALDSYKLADVGKDVTDAGTVEKFTNALISLLGKFEIENKEYRSRLNSIMVDSFEWGGFIERALIDWTKIVDDPMFNLTDGTDYSSIEHKFYQPKVYTKIFEEGKAIMAPISIQSEALREAFRSWDALNSYLSAIRMAVRSTLNLALDVYQHMLVSCGIALSSSTAGLNNAVHLITEAVADGILDQVEGANPTAKQAMNNPAFLAYAMEKIANVNDNLYEASTAYNNGNTATFASEVGRILLSQFKNAVKFRLLANTYNPSELGIGEYDTVATWQSSYDGTSHFDFDTVSSISISADPQNKLGIGTSAFEKDNIVAFLFDKRALGFCLRRSKVTSSYTSCADFWNEFHHELVNYLLDSNFGMVAFILD